MKITILFFALLLLPSASSAQTEIQVGITTVSDVETLGMTLEEIGKGEGILTPIWKTRNCCEQSVHRYGLISNYCFEESMQHRIYKTEACQILGTKQP